MDVQGGSDSVARWVASDVGDRSPCVLHPDGKAQIVPRTVRFGFITSWVFCQNCQQVSACVTPFRWRLVENNIAFTHCRD